MARREIDERRGVEPRWKPANGCCVAHEMVEAPRVEPTSRTSGRIPLESLSSDQRFHVTDRRADRCPVPSFRRREREETDRLATVFDDHDACVIARTVDREPRTPA